MASAYTSAILAPGTTHAESVVNTAAGADRGVIYQLFFELGLSRNDAHTVQVYLSGPLKIALVVVIAFVLTRLVSRLSHRLVSALRLVSPLVGATGRSADRVRTLAGAFTSIFRVIIWVIALVTILGQLNIDLTPFVATATIVGAAVGFGAQTLVKDFLSGVLILAEDQYGVGDHVVIGTGSNPTSGTVESVNLRVTRLRALDGGVLYIPNGDIRTLSNDTETDSQAIIDVVVPFGTDLAAAGRSAEGAARAMAAEPAWRELLIGQPTFAGVQNAAAADGITIRVLAVTRPGQHFRVAREMRLRVIEGLRADGVAWQPPPTPGQISP